MGCTHTQAHHFNGHFPGNPGLAGFPLDSQYPIILIYKVSSWDRPELFISSSHFSWWWKI